MRPLVVTTFSEKMPLSAGLATLIGDRTTDYPVVMAASLLATSCGGASSDEGGGGGGGGGPQTDDDRGLQVDAGESGLEEVDAGTHGESSLPWADDGANDDLAGILHYASTSSMRARQVSTITRALLSSSS